MTKDKENKFELRKFVAPEFIFGDGAVSLTAEYLIKFGAKKVFVVTDEVLIKYKWVTDVLLTLNEAGIKYTLFTNVSPNPRDFQVMEGAEEYSTSGCNVILAIGGGSVLDCAKGIGIVTANGKHILNYEGVDKVDLPIPPLLCIPTTSGSSADVSQFCIIRDTNLKVKKAIISKAVVPDLSLIDPRTIHTMDKELTANTGIDALVHAIEAFVSNASSHFTDNHSLQAIKLVKENLLSAIEFPGSSLYRGKMMLASLEAGLAFSNASLGAVHALSHSLGGMLDLPHGNSNALLLEHVVNFNYKKAPERFDVIAEVFDINVKGMNSKQKNKAIFETFRDFRIKSGIVKPFSQLGVRSSEIPQLAKLAHNDPCLVTNPRRANVRDIEVIYEEAL